MAAINSLTGPHGDRSASVKWLAVLATAAAHVIAIPHTYAGGTLDVAIGNVVKQIIAGDQCAHENKEARRTHYFDLDNNGSKDAVVLMAIEGGGCGNNYSFHMAAFRNEGRTYSLTDHRAIGGTWNAHPDFEKVIYRNGQIVLRVRKHAENDPACCPSLKQNAFYALQNGKLVEIKSTPR